MNFLKEGSKGLQNLACKLPNTLLFLKDSFIFLLECLHTDPSPSPLKPLILKQKVKKKKKIVFHRIKMYMFTRNMSSCVVSFNHQSMFIIANLL